MDAGVSFAAVTTRNEGLKVTGKVGFSDHPMIEHFKFVAAHTKRTPKITIPAPSAAYGRPMRTPIDAKTYPKLDRFFDDLGQAYKKAVRAFADAGCRYLQLDEVFIAMLCDPKYRQTMKDRGDDPEAARRALWRSRQYGDVGYSRRHDDHHAYVPRQLQIDLYGSGRIRSRAGNPVQQDQGARILHGVRHRSCRRFRAVANAAEGRVVVLGLVTSKSGRLEPKDEIRRRIEQAARYVSLDQLCLSPQCGFASTEEGNVLAEDEQWAKLRMIVELADEVWG